MYAPIIRRDGDPESCHGLCPDSKILVGVAVPVTVLMLAFIVWLTLRSNRLHLIAMESQRAPRVVRSEDDDDEENGRLPAYDIALKEIQPPAYPQPAHTQPSPASRHP